MLTVALIFIRSGYNLVIFGVIFGAISYVRTHRFRQQTGVYPWGVPPVVWAVLSFFIALFGTLLSLIACATTTVPSGRPGNHGAPGAGIPRGSLSPAPGTTGSPAAAPPPGWHPDPVARHEHRYWDGDRWTEHVVSGGTPAVDPI